MYDTSRVLVVDAGQPGFRTLRALLVAAGVAVDCCGSAAGAMRLVDERLFDGAVVDFGVSDLDPLVLCAFLRKVQAGRRALIIGVASDASSATYAEGLVAGCDTVVQAPADPAALALLLLLLVPAMSR